MSALARGMRNPFRNRFRSAVVVLLLALVSVTAIFFNSLWGRPSLFIDAILSVGKPVAPLPALQKG